MLQMHNKNKLCVFFFLIILYRYKIQYKQVNVFVKWKINLSIYIALGISILV